MQAVTPKIFDLGAKLSDWWRYITLSPKHKRNITKARRLFLKLSDMAGSEIDLDRARLFGYIRKIDAFLFEELVLQAFKACGFRVRYNRRYTGDYGIDGHVMVDGQWCPVQCKRYSSAIDPQHVREFSRLRHSGRYRFFVHTGRTGGMSRLAARESEIIMVSGGRLVDLLAGRFAMHR